MKILYKTAKTGKDFNDGRELFHLYARSLDIDLSFQDFEAELKTIHKQYNRPEGALILAYNGKVAVGCSAVRRLEADTAELKRMYVRPEFRGNRIGQKLLELSVEAARELKYIKIRLDTLPEMIQAQKLYRSFGFYEIPSYRFNPVQGTIYMEMIL